MNGKQWTVFGILVGATLTLVGLGFAAMSTNPPFTVPTWVPTVFFIAAGMVLATSVGYLIYNMVSRVQKEEKKRERQPNDSTVLLQLLDEIYQETHLVTERTINQLRDNRWQGMNGVFQDVTGLDPKGIAVAIQCWAIKGTAQFISGEELTIYDDADVVAKKIKDAITSKSPDLLAVDLSLSIRHRFLDDQLKHDHTYDDLQRRLRRERDKFPDELTSNSIDSFLEHSFKVNAIWLVAEYDLIHIPTFEQTYQYKILPGPILLRVENIPNFASTEMERYRNKVAVNIKDFLKAESGRIVHRKIYKPN